MALLEPEITRHPDRLRWISTDLVGHLPDRVGSIEVDLDDRLPDYAVSPTAGLPVLWNGWLVDAHPLVLDQLKALLVEVEKLRCKDPQRYGHKNASGRDLVGLVIDG